MKLTGHLIWYKDHVRRSYDCETIRAELDELKYMLNKDNEERKKALPHLIPHCGSGGKPEPETVEEKKPEDKSDNKQSETADEQDPLYPESEERHQLTLILWLCHLRSCNLRSGCSPLAIDCIL